jgi:hypothetical protein
MAMLTGYLYHQHLPLLPTRRLIARPLLQSVARAFRVNQIPIVRGDFRASSPVGSFFGGFRTPATAQMARSFTAGIRNPAPKRSSPRIEKFVRVTQLRNQSTVYCLQLAVISAA